MLIRFVGVIFYIRPFKAAIGSISHIMEWRRAKSIAEFEVAKCHQGFADIHPDVNTEVLGTDCEGTCHED